MKNQKNPLKTYTLDEVVEKLNIKQPDLGEMISFWIQKHGSLDLDTSEETIKAFYYTNNDNDNK